MLWRTATVIGLLASLAACRAAPVEPPADEVLAIGHMLDELYESFCFDAGGEADWERMRSLFAEGAAFVGPIGDEQTPRAVRSEVFLSDFRTWILETDVGRTGLHERIVHARIDLFGKVAHAYVTFEGFVPPDSAAERRGVDSIQLVKDGERWLVASFTTQYAKDGAPLPARFLR
jgi:hypothetical protein